MGLIAGSAESISQGKRLHGAGMLIMATRCCIPGSSLIEFREGAKTLALVVMTGASGSGKTAIAEAIEVNHPSITVFRFDTIGVPSAAIMATFGTGHQPGGPGNEP